MNRENLSDLQLLSLVKENDAEAFSELSERYLWLVRENARRFVCPGSLETDDLLQEGLMGLYVAALSWQEGGGSSFRTYAGICISRRMTDAVRIHSSGKNRPLNESVPLESADVDLAGEGPEFTVELRERFQAALRKLEGTLSPLERLCLLLYLEGEPRSEIPQKTGISLKAYDNALRRAREKLRKS